MHSVFECTCIGRSDWGSCVCILYDFRHGAGLLLGEEHIMVQILNISPWRFGVNVVDGCLQ
jgi:hypothetical protein